MRVARGAPCPPCRVATGVVYDYCRRTEGRGLGDTSSPKDPGRGGCCIVESDVI